MPRSESFAFPRYFVGLRPTDDCGRLRKFPFRKRSLPFETVDAISHNGRCHLKRSMPFLMTVDAIVKVDVKKEPIFPTLSDDMRDNQSNA